MGEMERSDDDDPQFYSLSEEELVHDDYIQAWVHCITLTEFTHDEGHLLSFCYPNDSLTEDEKKRLAVENLPETNVINCGGEVQFAFRFRLSDTHAWLSAPKRNDSVLQGVSVFFARVCNKSERKIRHFALTVLSPMIWYDVLQFICRTIMSETNQLAPRGRSEGRSYDDFSPEVEHIEQAIKMVYDTIRQSIASSFPTPFEPLDIIINENSERNKVSPHQRRYRMRCPSVPAFYDSCRRRSFLRQLISEVDINRSRVVNQREMICSPETLMPEHRFANIASAIAHLDGYVACIWEQIVLGKSVIVLATSPAVTSTAVLLFTFMVGSIVLAADVRPYVNSMSVDYTELMDVCRKNRFTPKEDKKNDLTTWWSDTQRRFINTTQKVAQDVSYSLAGSLADGFIAPGLSDLFIAKTIPLPFPVILGMTNPISLHHLCPFDCTVVLDHPISSSSAPNRDSQDHVPLVYKKKHPPIANASLPGGDQGPPSPKPIHHTWLSASQNSYIGASGAKWALDEISKARESGDEEKDEVQYLIMAFHKLSDHFLAPLERELRDISSHIRESIKLDPLCSPLRPRNNGTNQLDEDILILFGRNSFITRLSAKTDLPEPFGSMDQTRLTSLYISFIESMNFQPTMCQIVSRINEELLLMRIVLLMHSQDRALTTKRVHVLRELMKSEAFDKLNDQSKLKLIQIKSFNES